MSVLEREGLEAVVAGAAAGDAVAFARIVDAYHADLRRVAYVVCGDVELAEDATQQAWQVAWRRLATLRNPGKLRGWLVAVAANEARKLAGRQRRRVVLEATVRELTAPVADPAGDPAAIDLSRALARLGPDDRSLLALRYVAGLDSFEIARLRGASASGTRARLARLLARLKTDLGDD